MRVERPDELPLAPERQVPTNRISTALASSSRSSIAHSARANSALRSSWRRLPGNRVHPVGDEHVAERGRVVLQPALQQRQPVVVALHRRAVLELGDLLLVAASVLLASR
ncbi:MAG: hypothetical protein R2731_19065 [Nocardioides sp.]